MFIFADRESFYQQCDPERENLCLYGAVSRVTDRVGRLKRPSTSMPIGRDYFHVFLMKAYFSFLDIIDWEYAVAGNVDGTWQVDLPAAEVPPEMPEPVLGINFAKEGEHFSYLKILFGTYLLCSPDSSPI